VKTADVVPGCADQLVEPLPSVAFPASAGFEEAVAVPVAAMFVPPAGESQTQALAVRVRRRREARRELPRARLRFAGSPAVYTGRMKSRQPLRPSLALQGVAAAARGASARSRAAAPA
jgi:hypothetical protein